MAKRKVCGLVLAAGLSSRMRGFKPLLPFGGSTVIECAVGSLLSAGCEQVVTMLGRRADEVRKVLGERFGERVIFALNPDYAATDMLRSVQIGCRSMPVCECFFLLPGDMPLIGQDTYRVMQSAYRGGVLLPLYGGRRRHPALIASALIPDILAYEGGDGLGGFFRTLGDVGTIEVGDEGVAVDLDTPDDYEKYHL